LWFHASPAQKSLRVPILKKPITRKRLVEWLKVLALVQTPVLKKKKKEKKKKERNSIHKICRD
jgi:hypothetical protein